MNAHLLAIEQFLKERHKPIRAGGRDTLVATDGSFQLQITAMPGTQEIVVDAEDPRGNSSQYRLSLSRNGRGRG